MSASAFKGPAVWGPAIAGAALFAVGVLGDLSAAWGYGLFLAASVLIAMGLALFCVFIFSSRFDTDALRWGFTWLFVLGAWCYVYSVCAFGGYFLYETLQGRMELRWIVFGPAVLAALIVLDVGLYRTIVRKNLPTYQRYRQYISRERADPAAMRRTLIDDVLVQKALWSISGFRWLRHTLIFWGFVLMFIVELAAVVFREALPAFGLPDIWREAGHPLRLALNFAFDFFGLMVLIGCILALAWRAMVNGTEQQKYTDTPTALFLFFVVLSGFLVEALRLAASPGHPYASAEFVGYFMATFLPQSTGLASVAFTSLWFIHVLGSCVFIAYVPVKRLIHSCATPIGRLMNSQASLLAAKRQGVISGLMMRRS